MGLTLVTATLPERGPLLSGMLATVAAQTVKPAAHVLHWDHGRGFVDTVNAAVAHVRTEWFCLVDDDDLLDPHHVETLTANLSSAVDIVWTWCRVEGRMWDPNESYQPGVLQARNYIPSNMAMRTELWRDLGGYRQQGEVDHPDWDLLRRAERVDARFRNVPEITWTYRFHGGNMSLR